MSKVLLDTFFDNCKDKPLMNQLISTLLPKLMELAIHFIGQHIVKKCESLIDFFICFFSFRFVFINLCLSLNFNKINKIIFYKVFDKSPAKDKEIIVRKLFESKDMLNKSKEGRNVFQHIGGDIYEISPEDWRSNLKRKDR